MINESRFLRKGTGKRIVAVYSSGPDETYVQAELLLLTEKAVEKFGEDVTVIGYYDVVHDVPIAKWLKTYDGRSKDFERLLDLRTKVSKHGFSNLIPPKEELP